MLLPFRCPPTAVQHIGNNLVSSRPGDGGKGVTFGYDAARDAERPVVVRACAPQARGGACTARCSYAASNARRVRGAAASAGRGARAGACHPRGPGAFDGAVGAAGRRQDDACSTDRWPHKIALHRRLRRYLRCCRPAQGRRGGAGDTGPRGARHHPVRRRGAPLQQIAARRDPPARRERNDHVHRRDDRESVVRGHLRAAVTHPGAHAEASDR